jgi:hypothetical protein
MEPGQRSEFPVRQFLSYLEYRGCDLGVTFPADITFVLNPRNGAEVQVPIARAQITAYMMYLICLELGVNMPDEFAAYQQLMDWAKPAGYKAGQ